MASAVTAAWAGGAAVAYTPRLNPAELRSAAATLEASAREVSRRSASVNVASSALSATGFAGPAAESGLARLDQGAAALHSQAATLYTMVPLLRAAAAAQEYLDFAAEIALRHRHYRTVVWLNQLSLQLDTELARALNRSRSEGFDRLVTHPDADLASLSAAHMATLPAATRQTIEAASGLVLEAGPGSTTVMVGNTVDPARVITMVAGATTGNPEQLAGELDKARRIADRTGAAVVVWQGYRPPQQVGLALSPASASEGSRDLAMFQAALEERYPRAIKSVVAHSYGTVVATKAAHDVGLLADDLWLLGSPGVAGGSVEELTLAGPDARVYVVDADRDPIALLRSGPQGVLGASPSHPGYGATGIAGVRGDHSAYFTDEAFLAALSQVPDPETEKSVPSASAT